MTNKHTQGQWEYFEQNHYKDIRAASINKKGHKEYIKITQYDGNKANARLIAASPMLLEALEAVVEGHQMHFDAMPIGFQSFINIAEQAIAKARGEV